MHQQFRKCLSFDGGTIKDSEKNQEAAELRHPVISFISMLSENNRKSLRSSELHKKKKKKTSSLP